jgi:hypothetical protein
MVFLAPFLSVLRCHGYSEIQGNEKPWLQKPQRLTGANTPGFDIPAGKVAQVKFSLCDRK